MREFVADTVSEYKTMLDDLFGRKKDIACFVACRIIEAHGSDVFEDFMLELGDGDTKNVTLLALRQKLLKDIDGSYPQDARNILAYTIMAFNAWRSGKNLKKLVWGVDAAMPAFDVPEEADEAEVEVDEVDPTEPAAPLRPQPTAAPGRTRPSAP